MGAAGAPVPSWSLPASFGASGEDRLRGCCASRESSGPPAPGRVVMGKSGSEEGQTKQHIRGWGGGEKRGLGREAASQPAADPQILRRVPGGERAAGEHPSGPGKTAVEGGAPFPFGIKKLPSIVPPTPVPTALHESMKNGERSSAKRGDGTDTRAKRGWERSAGVTLCLWGARGGQWPWPATSGPSAGGPRAPWYVRDPL